MVFSNVIVDVTVPRRSSVFSQSSVQISAGLTDIGESVESSLLFEKSKLQLVS